MGVRRWTMRALLAVLCTAIVGCGGRSSGDEDTAVDTLPDTADTAGDTGADTGADTAVDTVGDTPVDTAIDTAEVTEDVPADEESDGTGPCTRDEDCMEGLHCCASRCVNFAHDPMHCGGCGNACSAPDSFCNSGTCTTTPCETECIGTRVCCGTNCCEMGQICCVVEGPGPVGGPGCYDEFCPGGCPLCD
jgi:hypothetical protein